jgi:hypothetical protein
MIEIRYHLKQLEGKQTKLHWRFDYRNIEMGFSDHFALFMCIFVHSPSICAKYVEKKIFSKNNITNFKNQLEIESCNEVYLHSDVNSANCIFLSKFRKYFLDSSPPPQSF